jgi:phage terminase small subunit
LIKGQKRHPSLKRQRRVAINSSLTLQARKASKRVLDAEPELQWIAAVDRLGEVETERGPFDQAKPGDVNA